MGIKEQRRVPGMTADFPLPGMILSKGEIWWGWSCKYGCGNRIEYDRQKPDPLTLPRFMQCRYCRKVHTYFLNDTKSKTYTEHPPPEPEPRLPELIKRPFPGDPRKRTTQERAQERLYKGSPPDK
jgi:hypothetical protein